MKLQLKRKTAWLLLAALLISGFNAGICADVAGHAHDTVSAYAATEIQNCKTCGGDGLVKCNNPKGTQGGKYTHKNHGDGSYHVYGCWPCGELTATTKHI